MQKYEHDDWTHRLTDIRTHSGSFLVVSKMPRNLGGRGGNGVSDCMDKSKYTARHCPFICITSAISFKYFFNFRPRVVLFVF